MTTPDGTPSKNAPDPEGTDLFEKVGQVLDKFVLLQVQPEEVLLEDALQNEDDQTYTCRYPSCDRVYIQEKRRNNHEINVHGIQIQDAERSPPNPRNEDGIFNYAHNILKTGLLLRDFQDAVREGDGGRIEYIWKFWILMFKVCGKTKYALAAIRLHAQLNALLTPREAHSLRWNRTINLKGGVGRNIAIDQAMEHNIRETLLPWQPTFTGTSMHKSRLHQQVCRGT